MAGVVAVGSDMGEIRLYNDISKNEIKQIVGYANVKKTYVISIDTIVSKHCLGFLKVIAGLMYGEFVTVVGKNAVN